MREIQLAYIALILGCGALSLLGIAMGRRSKPTGLAGAVMVPGVVLLIRALYLADLEESMRISGQSATYGGPPGPSSLTVQLAPYLPLFLLSMTVSVSSWMSISAWRNGHRTMASAIALPALACFAIVGARLPDNTMNFYQRSELPVLAAAVRYATRSHPHQGCSSPDKVQTRAVQAKDSAFSCLT